MKMVHPTATEFAAASGLSLGPCRNASPKVLREAVVAVLRCTHVHPVAIDGAFVIALAVGYLARRQPSVVKVGETTASSVPTESTNEVAGDGEVATPVGLLDHLLSHQELLETEGMTHKLQSIRAALAQVRWSCRRACFLYHVTVNKNDGCMNFVLGGLTGRAIR